MYKRQKQQCQDTLLRHKGRIWTLGLLIPLLGANQETNKMVEFVGPKVELGVSPADLGEEINHLENLGSLLPEGRSRTLRLMAINALLK